MKSIHFIGLGAPKCGTTWLAKCLDEHPDIGFAEDKELYFFGDPVIRRYLKANFEHYSKGVNWYHEQFPSGNYKSIGEYCPSYLYAPEAPGRIASYNPNIKLILCLRDPADMLYSWYWYHKNGLIAELPETFEKFIQIDFFRELGNYYSYIQRFEQELPHAKWHVIHYQDILAEPARVLDNVYSFLGVDTKFTPESMDSRINMAASPKFKVLQKTSHHALQTLKSNPVTRPIVCNRGIERTLKSLYNKVNKTHFSYPPMETKTRDELTTYFAEDQTKLNAWIEAQNAIKQ